MSFSAWNPIDQEALRIYYDSGQLYSFHAIEAALDITTKALKQWIDDSPIPRENSVVLPVFRSPTADPEWFAIAFSNAQAEELRAELNAFVGPVGSDFDGQRAQLDLGNLIDAAVHNWAGGNYIYKLRVIPSERNNIRFALKRLRQVWRLRPEKPSFIFRTTNALLREFFTAVTNQDFQASEKWLVEIKNSGRLSVENVKFLEIERLGGLKEWDEIALNPHLSLLTTIRRPRRITALVLEALWRTELQNYCLRQKPAEAIAYMRESFYPRYQGLLSSRGCFKQPAVILTFLVAAVAANPPRVDQIPGLLSDLVAGTPERAFGAQLVNLIAPVSCAIAETTPTQQVQNLLALSNYDAAWVVAQTLPKTPETVEIMLACAAEIYTLEVAQIALDSLDALPESASAKILNRRSTRLLYDSLNTLLSEKTAKEPHNWEEWLDAISSNPDAPSLMEAARDAHATWPLEGYWRDPARVKRLSGKLLTLPASSLTALRFALPHFVSFFLGQGENNRVFSPLYEAVLLLLALDDEFGAEDWAFSQNLAYAVLSSGPNIQKYTEAVDALTTIWETRGQISRLDWALDQLDSLVTMPPISLEARNRFFTSVWQTIAGNRRRVGTAHLEMFRLLCGDLERSVDFQALPSLPVDIEATLEADAYASLSNKLVAIYTLVDSAASRAKLLIEKLCPDVRVKTNSDHVGTESLKALSRDADYFIVAARSAKHAATLFIKAERLKSKKELIYPSGKGASSILTALVTAIRNG